MRARERGKREKERERERGNNYAQSGAPSMIYIREKAIFKDHYICCIYPLLPTC